MYLYYITLCTLILSKIHTSGLVSSVKRALVSKLRGPGFNPGQVQLVAMSL